MNIKILWNIRVSGTKLHSSNCYFTVMYHFHLTMFWNLARYKSVPLNTYGSRPIQKQCDKKTDEKTRRDHFCLSFWASRQTDGQTDWQKIQACKQFDFWSCRYVCQALTKVSSDGLSEDGPPMRSKRAKCSLDFDFQNEYRQWKHSLLILLIHE